MEEQQSRPGFGYYVAGSVLGILGINNLLSSIDKLMTTKQEWDAGYSAGYLTIPIALIVASAILLYKGFRKTRDAKKNQNKP